MWDAQVRDAQVRDAQVQDAQVRDARVRDAQVQDARVWDAQVQSHRAFAESRHFRGTDPKSALGGLHPSWSCTK